MNEIDKFFDGLPKQDVKIEDPLKDTNIEKKSETTDNVEKPEKEESDDESPARKNRRHRRIEEQLQKEREANIALTERIKVLAEQDKIVRESDGTIDPRLVRVFGTTDEGKEVAKHFSEILAETKQSAREEAIREIEQQRTQQIEEQKQYESFIDNELESLEDEYNVDLTSDAPVARKARREFLEMVQSLSPKDENGTITGYADFGSTFELYKEKHTEKTDTTRRDEIASKSMQKSGSGSGSQRTEITSGFRGWEKDFGLQ